MPNVMRRLVMVIPVRVVVFWISISLLLAMVSAFLAYFWGVGGNVEVPWRLAAICGITSIFGFLSFISIVNLFETDWLKRNLIPFFDPLTRHHFVQAFVASVVLTSLCFLVVLGLSKQGTEVRDLALSFVNNPGGLFALLSGIASFVGIYVTLQSVLEFRQTDHVLPGVGGPGLRFDRRDGEESGAAGGKR